MATDINGGGTGTQIQPGAQGSILSAIDLTPQLVTNALVSPWAAPNALAVPTTDQVIKTYDAAGKEAIWTYRTTGAGAPTATGVQVS